MAGKSDTSTLVSQHTAPTSFSTSPSANTVSESMFSRVFVGPLLFISFMISLCLVDQKTGDRVFAYSDSAHELSRSSDPGVSDERPDRHYKSNGKKLARQEMEDAFHVRKKVMAVLLILAGITLVTTWWLLCKVAAFFLQ